MAQGQGTPRPALTEPSRARAQILEQTERVRPVGVPELELHLVTSRCPLWTGDAESLRRLGWSEPFWAFAWAGGQALARWILDHPEAVQGSSVLDVGAGSGLVALAARMAGATRVVASDVDPRAVAAIELNAEINGLTVQATDQDFVGRWPLPFDVVLLGDVTYDPDLGRRIGAWARELARHGVVLYAGDPDRGFLDLDGFQVVATVPASSDVDDTGTHLVDTHVLRIGDVSRGPIRTSP